MTRWIVEILACTGAVLVLLAGVGVVRFPDVYARMHAAAKASTLGIALIGIAAAVALEGRAKTLVAVAFIFITAPSAAHFVARAAYRAEGIEIDLTTRDELADVIEHGGRPAGAPEGTAGRQHERGHEDAGAPMPADHPDPDER